MARVKIEYIIDHLSSDIRRALEDAVKDECKGVNFDAHQLFRAFKRRVGSKCSTWVRVPDHYVEEE